MTTNFEHHPDADIDARIEIERLQGCLATAHAGLRRALNFRGVTPESLAIKNDVRWALKESGYDKPLGEAQ